MKKYIFFFLCLIFIETNFIYSEIPTNGIVAYYPFNGNANDESGNNRNGTQYGSTISYPSGVIGSCVKFDNYPYSNWYYVNDYIQLPDLSINSQFTVSFWIRIDGTYDNNATWIVPFSIGDDKFGNTPRDFLMIAYIINVTDLDCYLQNGTNGASANITTINYGEWKHISVVIDNNSIKTYLNGQLLHSEIKNFDLQYNNLPNYLSFHQWVNGSMHASRFNGAIDELYLYNRALSSSEIQELYNEGTEVTIGTQTWMNRNLDVAYYRNGDLIPQVTDGTQWTNLTTGAWCYYNNDPVNGAIYGKLYNWYAVNDPRGLAPEGWHVPSDGEWHTFANYLGGDANKIKETGTTHWQSPNSDATNESGFTALGGGWRRNDGGFYDLTIQGNWFASDDYDAGNAYTMFLRQDDYPPNISLSGGSKHYGFSIRCIKDVTSTVVPSVEMVSISDITKTSASAEGIVTSSGSSNVTSRGFVWSTSLTFTITNHPGGGITSNGSGTGNYTGHLTNLTEGTKYYIKAYATNSAGTGYSGNFEFTTKAPYITITSPKEGKEYQSEEKSCVITWESNDVDKINIQYTVDYATLIPKWYDIENATEIDASSHSFTDWTTPYTLSSTYKIRITDVDNPEISTESASFGIVDMIDFLPSKDGFNFSNSATFINDEGKKDALLWPKKWWSQIDYANRNHEVKFGSSLKPSNIKKNYPKWKLGTPPNKQFPSFDDYCFAFGEKMLFQINYNYNPLKVIKYRNDSKDFNGSCVGMAYLSILFKDRYFEEVFNKFPMKDNEKGRCLNNLVLVSDNRFDEIRSIINGNHSFQFADKLNTDRKKNQKLSNEEKIAELRLVFKEINKNKIFNSLSYACIEEYLKNGLLPYDRRSHALIPYKIKKDIKNNKYLVYVYDCNYNEDNSKIITMFIDRDEWYYTNYSGGKKTLMLSTTPAKYFTENWAEDVKNKSEETPLSINNNLEIYFRSLDSVSIPNVRIIDKFNNKYNSYNSDSNKIENSIEMLNIGGSLETGGKADLLGLFLSNPQSDTYTTEFYSDDKGQNKSIFATTDKFSIDANWFQTDTIGKQTLMFNMNNYEGVLSSDSLTSENNILLIYNDQNENQLVVEIDGISLHDKDSLKTRIFNDGKLIMVQSFGDDKSYNIRLDNLYDTLQISNLVFTTDKEKHFFTIDNWDSLATSEITIEIDKSGDSTIDSVIHIRGNTIQITTQPQSQNICRDETVKLNVEANIRDIDSTELNYTWYRDNFQLDDNSIYSGTKTNELTITDISNNDEGNYFAYLSLPSSTIGKYTDNAVVIVKEPPVITEVLPPNLVLDSGATLVLHVKVMGDEPLSYQWYKDSLALYNGTYSILSLPNVKPENTGFYYCIVNNECGSIGSSSSYITITLPDEVKQMEEYSDYYDVELIPNPSDNIVNVNFNLFKNGNVSMKLIDQSGHIIKQLVNSELLDGKYYFVISKSDLQLSNGIYYLVINHEKTNEVKKILYIK